MFFIKAQTGLNILLLLNMGIIKKQSINNSINLYLGIIIGAINTILIFPHVFENNPEYWGLLQIIVSYSIVFSTFSHLGSPNILLRFFPRFKEKSQLLSFSILLCSLGFLVFVSLFFIFKNKLLISIDATPLLQDYFYLVTLLVFCLCFFDLFSSLSRSYLDSSTPLFLNEVFVRICVLILLVLYKFKWIDFTFFIHSYILIYFSKLLILLFIQIKQKRISFSFNFSKPKILEQFKYGFYVLTAGAAAVLVSRFDMLMIEYYLDLKQVAYYGLAFFIGSVIKVPSRSISLISSPLIAKYFEKEDMSNIQTIYSKTSINLLIIGGLIFLCVILNINDILSILPEKFSHGKNVVLFIGLAQMVNLAAGLHGLILLHSSYYKSIIYFNLLLFIITFLTNLLFIPIYGIDGAALATLVSLFIFNAVRMIYVYKKMRLHPFSSKTVILLFVILFSFFLVEFIPLTSILILNIFIRCLFVMIIVATSVKLFNISEDISQLIRNNLDKIIRK